MHAYLLFNEYSRRARAERITRDGLLKLLCEYGIEAEDLPFERVEDIPDAVMGLEPGSVLIIAGGDGTIYQAVQCPVCLTVRVGLIPLGASNNLAASAGIPMEIEAAIATIVEGREKRIDLGRADDKVFTQAAGAGFHAEAFRLYGERREKSLREAIRAFVRATALWKPQPMAIIADGKQLCEVAFQVTVSNTPVYGRGFQIAPDARIDDGLLDVTIIRCMNKPELVGIVLDLMEVGELDPAKVRRVTARHIEIASLADIPVPMHADAEPIGFAPVTIEVQSLCLTLIVPR